MKSSIRRIDRITTSGPLFEAVQRSRIFSDSKYFTDCVPAGPPESIMEEWKRQKDSPEFDLLSFVNAHFNAPDAGNHFENSDSDAEMPTVENCREHIKKLWLLLFRASGKSDQTERNDSLLPLPHPYVVPGGRFREIYYWDSYFTALGLAADGHAQKVLDMTRNFAHLIQSFGHVPNGNRTYYLSRSQPPFFVMMVELCAVQFGEDIIQEFLPALRREHAFWHDDYDENENRRCVKVSLETTSDNDAQSKTGVLVKRTLNRYWDDHPEPREESYHEDFSLASGLIEVEQKRLYRNIRAACESGWDFTCRWFADGKNLSKINTTNILPVDLNSLLWHLERRLAEWIPSSERDEKRYFREKSAERNMLIQALMWNEASGFFHDVLRNTLQPTKILSLAGVYPLFCGLATQNQADRIALRIEKEFLKPGGLVSTLEETGQQWDYPNGWAPLQWISFKGFKNYNLDEIARKIRTHWLYANDVIFEREKKMVEKYNVVSPEGEAGGGEYPLQDGFGWSNGIYAALYDEQ